MSDIDMATTGDISGAKAYADRIVNNLKKDYDSRITQLETKVEDLRKDNVEFKKIVGKLQKDNAELRKALRAAGISVGTKEE